MNRRWSRLCPYRSLESHQLLVQRRLHSVFVRRLLLRWTPFWSISQSVSSTSVPFESLWCRSWQRISRILHPVTLEAMPLPLHTFGLASRGGLRNLPRVPSRLFQNRSDRITWQSAFRRVPHAWFRPFPTNATWHDSSARRRRYTPRHPPRLAVPRALSARNSPPNESPRALNPGRIIVFYKSCP